MKPDYKITNKCIIIYNSYLTPKKEYRPTLEEIKEDDGIYVDTVRDPELIMDLTPLLKERL